MGGRDIRTVPNCDRAGDTMSAATPIREMMTHGNGGGVGLKAGGGGGG